MDASRQCAHNFPSILTTRQPNKQGPSSSTVRQKFVGNSLSIWERARGEGLATKPKILPFSFLSERTGKSGSLRRSERQRLGGDCELWRECAMTPVAVGR